jgi:release factor glutamine methyltransferase
MFSWGRLRNVLQPILVKYWLDQRAKKHVRTRVAGFDLEVLPGVFHPRYFGSSSILANFVSSLPLSERSFLEVGSGSGVVSLCAARAGAAVTAVDINPDAVRCTLDNAGRNRLRVDARAGDLFAPVAGMQFAVIAWNPPFLPAEPRTPAEAAFYGGPDYDVIRRFAGDVRRFVLPGGSVYTILSADVAIGAIEEMFRREAFDVSRALSARWGLRETMVILCAQ